MALALVLLNVPAAALSLHSHSAALSGPGWRAEGVDLTLAMTGTRATLRLHVDRLQLTAALPPVSGLDLDCPALAIAADGWRCPSLSLQAAALAGRSLTGQGRFEFQAPHTLTLDLPRLDWGEASFRLTAADHGPDWHLALHIRQLTLAALRRWLGKASGELGGTLDLAGRGVALRQARLSLSGQALTFNAGAGRYAGDHLTAALTAGWQVDGAVSATARLSQGQLYLDPLYWQLQAGGQPLTLSADGRWQGSEIQLSPVRLEHPGVVQARASLTLDTQAAWPLQQATIELQQARLPAFYTTYLQPWFAGTALASVTTQGRLHGRLSVAGKRLRGLDLQLDGVGLHGQAGRFAVDGLAGRLLLNPDQTPRASGLSWQGARFYRIALGAGSLALSSHDDQLQLRRPAAVAVLDGAIRLRQLQLGGFADGPWLRFGGRLQGLSLKALSMALGWPPLAGTLTGIIPKVSYRNHRVDVGGALLVKVFGGDVTVANLSLQHPLGDQPQLHADVELFQLDLQQLTKTFDFGRIEGKLSGYIHGLTLSAWRPVAFDAFLHTPKGDHSRHRISQRAVQALSSLGGASAAGLLSRGFLSLFQEFDYARLGIRCRLRNGICEMGGVAPGPKRDDYYLVEGRGLPRIDVIGYNRRVDWPDLLARLAAAIHSQGPVIK